MKYPIHPGTISSPAVTRTVRITRKLANSLHRLDKSPATQTRKKHRGKKAIWGLRVEQASSAPPPSKWLLLTHHAPAISKNPTTTASCWCSSPCTICGLATVNNVMVATCCHGGRQCKRRRPSGTLRAAKKARASGAHASTYEKSRYITGAMRKTTYTG